MEHGNYVIVGTAANLYRAVGGALVDLEIARRMIACCVSQRDGEDEHLADCEEAFWTAGLVRFRRAFVKGRHIDWDHDKLLRSLSPQLLASYERFYMLADKFVAHPVGIGEDFAVTAVLGPAQDGSVTVYGGALRKRRVSSPGTNLAKEFHALLSALIPLVAKRESEAHEEFLREIKGWPSADLLRGGLYVPTTHFDETSRKYRDALKSYRRTPALGTRGASGAP